MAFRFSRRELPALQTLFRKSLALSFLLLFAGWIALPANAAIKLVQHRSVDAGTAAASSLSFSINNAPRDWIAVTIRAGHSGQVFGVSDTRGNTYRQAVQLNQTLDTPTGDTVAIFYAENIGGGANTVTVTKSIADTLRFAILEYSGVATTNSLDAIAAAQGNGTSANSGSAATAAGDLLLGAVMTGDWTAYAPGSDFTIEESVLAASNAKLAAEDSIQVTAGAAAASATLSSSNSWGAILAAFKAATGLVPSITSVGPASGVVGASVTITGTNFGGTQGSSTVTFSGTTASPTSWNATSIAVAVPVGATTGNVLVRVSGVASNGMNFTVTSASSAPSITSVSPASGAAGMSVTITGTNFGSSQESSTVTFGGTTAVTFSNWSATSITVVVPVGAITGNVVVVVSSVASNGMNFTVASSAPSITSVTPASGIVGASVTLAGTNFGGTQGSSTVTFNGTTASPTSWSATSIAVAVPAGATTGNAVVTVGTQASNGIAFTVTSAAPSITSINPASGAVGASVTLTGANFGRRQRSSTVTFNGTTASPTSWSATSIAVTVPAGATTGSAVVTVGAQSSNGMTFTVTSSGPSITSINPASGAVGASATLTGTNFGGTQGSSTVTFNGTTASPTSWSATSIAVTVPAGATTGNAVVTVGAQSSKGMSFTVTSPAPTITSVTPASGAVGASVTLTGTNFGGTQGSSTVTFNGTTASPTSWSATSIAVTVPAGATTGSVVLTVLSQASNGANFTVVLDTTPPTVSITAPVPGATVSGTVSITANASDNVAVANVQFQVDGSNVGSPDAASPYSYSLNTTTLTNGSHTLTAVAKDAAGNSATSSGVIVTVTNVVNTSMGPLVHSSSNAHYFVNPAGRGVLLAGSQAWDDEQDTDLSTSPAALDFTGYVNFLKSHGHSVTILWHKDLPTYCNWGPGGTWTMGPFPWQRTGAGNASDGKPQFDLTQYNQAYFDRLLARVSQLQQNGIYAIVQLFDGLGLTNNRCAVDGYPFTGGNNVNGVDDGGGTNSMTMSGPNTITGYQDAYVQKVIDTLNGQPNVLWEISEEAPDNSTWWQGHMISLIRSYEGGKAWQHPIGFPSLNVSGTSDSTLYNSNADWVAPMARISPTSSCGTGTPACKVNINDTDHSYYGMWNDTAQVNRNFIWENFSNGDSVMFMDPYLIDWPSSNRNLCSNPVNGVCSGVDTRWDNFRDNMGYIASYANTKLDLVKMTPQGNLSSTGYCLADNVAAGAEYVVYAPNGGSFTVNLSATTHVLNVEWFNPSTGTTSSAGLVTGGTTVSFTPPFSGDAVLYLVDAAGHN